MTDISITIAAQAACGKTSIAHLLRQTLRSYGVTVEIVGNDERRQDISSDELAMRLIALRGKTVRITEVCTQKEPQG